MSIDMMLVTCVAIVIHSAIVLTASIVSRNHSSVRNKRLWALGFIDVLLFPIVILLFYTLRSPNTLLDEFSLLSYALIISFTAAIEVPGYLILSRFDDSSVEKLTHVRAALLDIKINFSRFSKFSDSVKENRDSLVASNVYALVVDFIKSCEQNDNLDVNIWNLVIGEINSNINLYSQISKHPVPKLIDILSLAGLSFIIAQVLKILG